MAKTSQRVRQARPAKYKTREYTRCRRCGRAARRLPQVRPVPDLPARARAQRLHPRHDEEQLVDRMSMTDPIADFLTRIRNGDPRAHETVDDPVVQAQARDGPHPQGAGLHRRLRGRGAERRPPRRAHPRPAQVHRATAAGDLRACSASRAPASATTSRHGDIPKVQGGMGTAIVSTSQGVMTGHEARQRGRRRRGRRGGLVAAMTPHRPQAHPRPRRRHRHDRARGRPRQRPAGRARPSASTATSPSSRTDERARSSRARPTAASTAPCTGSRARSWPTWSRASPTATRRRLEIQGVGYRAAAQGQATSSSRSATRTRCRSRRPTASSSRSRSPRASIVKGISKQLVGEIAANIRKQRPPEPYKGKGIRYEGEYVARKVGKRA